MALILWEFREEPQIYRDIKKSTRHRKRRTAAEGRRVATSSRKRGRHEEGQESSAEPSTKRRRGDTAQTTRGQRGQIDDPAGSAAVHPEAMRIGAEKRADQASAGAASEEAAAQQLTTKTAKKGRGGYAVAALPQDAAHNRLSDNNGEAS
ncbi:hypothetical protein DL768_005171 [Monosporascus sp. mg162]|nr:hypothetical protein DL768_005171 [Monosporascus sp. mg162]